MSIHTEQYTKRTKSISVNRSTRACINCQYYEQYYRENRGNVRAWVPVDTGFCIKLEARRGALRQPCKHFLKED